MNVFRRKRGRHGKSVRDAKYTGRYKLSGDVKWTTVPLGITDKRVAEDKLRQIVASEERQRAGLLLPAAEVLAAGISLAEHLRGFLGDLEARGTTRGYRADIRNRVRVLLVDCGWVHAKDVTAESFIAWRSRQKGKSAKTLNGYLDAVSALLKWLKDQGRVSDNPMSRVQRSEVRGRQVFDRDALSVEECGRLLCHAGGNRRALYLVALLTGLRRGTLQRLTWGDVHLDGDKPFIVVRAAINKNREEQCSELRDDVAAELSRIRPAIIRPSAFVFDGILPARGTDFLKVDLKAAGIMRDGRKRIDFHALRHTACTFGANTGAAGSVLRQFTGHKTESQVKRYTHMGRASARGVVDLLPRFDEVLNGTHIGTHGGTYLGVVGSDGVSRSVAVGERDVNGKTLKNKGKRRAVSGSVAVRREDMSECPRQESNL